MLPKKIKICGRTYDVVFPYSFVERGDLSGWHDGDMNKILIDGKDSYSHKERLYCSVVITFIHEVLHAIDYVTGHHIFKDHEDAIEGFSETIYQILIDNGYLKDGQGET